MKLIDKLNALSSQLDIAILNFQSTNLKIITLVKERKKHFELFNPLVIFFAVNEKGEDVIKLVPYMPPIMVDSGITIVRKKQVQVFIPSDNFIQYYMTVITAIAENDRKEQQQKESPAKKEKKGKNGEANNIVSFSKFRDLQKEIAKKEKKEEPPLEVTIVAVDESANNDPIGPDGGSTA